MGCANRPDHHREIGRIYTITNPTSNAIHRFHDMSENASLALCSKAEFTVSFLYLLPYSNTQFGLSIVV